MRFRSRLPGTTALIVAAAALSGCSSGTSQGSLSTASLGPPRPHEGMAHYPRRTYPDGSTQGRPYTTHASGPAGRQYVDPGTATPRHMAGHHPPPSQIQTSSLGQGGNGRGPSPYDPNARWQQPSPIVTGSTGPAHQSAMPHVIEVREGDTLYGLSRRYNVPMQDLASANRLSNDRIAVGQRLVIPTRYR